MGRQAGLPVRLGGWRTEGRKDWGKPHAEHKEPSSFSAVRTRQISTGMFQQTSIKRVEPWHHFGNADSPWMSALILPAPFPARSSSLRVPGAFLRRLSLRLTSTSCGLTASGLPIASGSRVPGSPPRAGVGARPEAAPARPASQTRAPGFASCGFIAHSSRSTRPCIPPGNQYRVFCLPLSDDLGGAKIALPACARPPPVHRLLPDEPSFLLTASGLIPPPESLGLHRGPQGFPLRRRLECVHHGISMTLNFFSMKYVTRREQYTRRIFGI